MNIKAVKNARLLSVEKIRAKAENRLNIKKGSFLRSFKKSADVETFGARGADTEAAGLGTSGAKPANAEITYAGQAGAKTADAAAPAETVEINLCYKKIYFLKVLALASRVPFPPKKVPYVIFYDPETREGGITYEVPESEQIEVDEQLVRQTEFSLEDFEKEQPALIEKYILKQYLLKRPEIELRGSDELYLPYYSCRFEGQEILFNAATGHINI